jgi:radical SAM protein with 4Fe4S-binding SPASM domain
MSDVARQAHYTGQDIEPIEYMRAVLEPREFEGYCRGNIIKYISRYPKKGGIEDLKKAKVYLDWLIKHIEMSCAKCPARSVCEEKCDTMKGLR